jgi:hypothetical protein
MDTPEPPRRWLSHEWTVLLVLAIVAALGADYVGRQASVVRYRRTMREQIVAGGAQMPGDDFIAVPSFALLRPADGHRSISWMRELLADEAVSTIWFDLELTASDREAIAAFPEAEVCSGSPPRMRPTMR